MSDIDPIRINYTDEFRRTKRNVLFWAAATIILTVGTLGSDVPIETSWAQNLKLPPALLTFCSWLVMLYMGADFIYANRRLADENSTLAARIVVNGTIKTSSELATRIRPLIAPLDQAVNAAIAHARTAATDADLTVLSLLEGHLGEVRLRVDEIEALPSRIESYAAAVDKRDKAWRALFYFWLTVVIAVIATVSAGFRIFGSQHARQAIAHSLHIESVDEGEVSQLSNSGGSQPSSAASLLPAASGR